MAMNKVGVSIAEMQQVLDFRDYKTAWLMAQKIRKAMADRNAQCSLVGLIEMDDSFFGPSGKVRERGTERKKTLLCDVSLYRDRKGKRRSSFAHMGGVVDVSAKSVDFLERLGCGSTPQEGCQLLEAIRSDGRKSYGKVARGQDLKHCKVVLRDFKGAGKLLPWVHRVISNTRAVIRGTHRGVSERHLGAHPSEICYQFSRRYWERELFDPLIKACVSADTITYPELINKKANHFMS